MNQFCLVGKIASLPVLESAPNGWNTCSVAIDVQRPYANGHGDYESDLIHLEVWRGAAETLASCAKLHSWISAKGRIQCVTEDSDTRIPGYKMVVEKLEYLH